MFIAIYQTTWHHIQNIIISEDSFVVHWNQESGEFVDITVEVLNKDIFVGTTHSLL
jgi:hypothetical protein